MKRLRKAFSSGAAFAAAPGPWQIGRCVTPDGVATIQGFECLFVNLLRVATTLAGLAFGLMVIVGGFRLIFSGGDQQGLQSAKKTFGTAFLGLILTLGLWFILLLIEKFTGVKVTEFKVPGNP